MEKVYIVFNNKNSQLCVLALLLLITKQKKEKLSSTSLARGIQVKNLKLKLLALLSLPLIAGSNAYANFIETSVDCPGDASCEPTAAGDAYGFTFIIDEIDMLGGTDVDETLFLGSLQNTSPSDSGEDGTGTLIDHLYFNIDAVLGTDFTIPIGSIDPNWTFSAPTGGGIQFDYVGDRSSPSDRLAPGDTLTFQFDFVDNFLDPSDPFSVWTGTDSSTGAGAGGGEDSGQLAVSFQNLEGTAGSDLVTGGYNGGNGVPEPSMLLLFGTGLFAVGFARRFRDRA